jgi:hypothetical protein
VTGDSGLNVTILVVTGMSGHDSGTMSYATVMVLRKFIHPDVGSLPGFRLETACPQQGSICARSKTSYVSNSKQGFHTNALRLYAV